MAVVSVGNGLVGCVWPWYLSNRRDPAVLDLMLITNNRRIKMANFSPICIHCGSKMIWGSDESCEIDSFIDSFYSCTNEHCETTATFTHKVRIRCSKEECLEIIRSVIDPDSELYGDIKHYIGD